VLDGGLPVAGVEGGGDVGFEALGGGAADGDLGDDGGGAMVAVGLT
jgi:hypothetical protein